MLRALTATTLAVLTCLSLGSPAEAASTFLRAGQVTGSIVNHAMRAGDSATWVAVKYGVHPVRVSSQGYGQLRVDARRVTPRFPTNVSGLVLNVPECQVYLVRDGVVSHDYPVAVSTPDNPVPIGTTRVVSKQKNPTWFIPASIQKEMAKNGRKVKTQVPPGPGNPLGPRWIGFWNGSFGMHGTNAPTSIKRYASHGCVRFRAADIKDLYDRVWIGTPIRVVYQPVLLAVDLGSVWISAYPDVYKQNFDYRGTVKALAAQAGVANQIDWAVVNTAIARKDGILRDVGPGHGVIGNPTPTGPTQPMFEVEPVDPETGLPLSDPDNIPTTVYEQSGQQLESW